MLRANVIVYDESRLISKKARDTIKLKLNTSFAKKNMSCIIKKKIKIRG